MVDSDVVALDASSSVLSFLAAPTDAGIDGTTVPIGRILEWIDRAGYACAAAWSGSYCVTAFVGDVHFLRTVLSGELVRLRAQLVHTGRTSMHILVSVESSSAQRISYRTAVTCVTIFVAIDEGRRPHPVPPWVPTDSTQRGLNERARARVPLRQELHEEIKRQGHTVASPSQRSYFRFLAAPSDANWSGNAHGGIVMRWISEAAHACASAWDGGNPTPVYAGGIHSYAPIPIGQIVEVDAQLVHTTAKSMHVRTRVSTAHPTSPSELQLTTQSFMIFQSCDDVGKPRTVPQIDVRSENEATFAERASRLMQLRTEIWALPLAEEPLVERPLPE